MKEFCSEHNQTVCSPCEEGYFSNQYTMFDRCEKCQSCQQGKTEISDSCFDFEIMIFLLSSNVDNALHTLDTR